jgi:hypothetical protein
MGSVRILEREAQKRIEIKAETFWKEVRKKGEVEVYLKKGEVIVLDSVIRCKSKRECRLAEEIGNLEGLRGFLVVRSSPKESFTMKILFSKESKEKL